MQEIKFKLNQVFRRNRNSDLNLRPKLTILTCIFQKFPEMGEVGPFPWDVIGATRIFHFHFQEL